MEASTPAAVPEGARPRAAAVLRAVERPQVAAQQPGVEALRAEGLRLEVARPLAEAQQPAAAAGAPATPTRNVRETACVTPIARRPWIVASLRPTPAT